MPGMIHVPCALGCDVWCLLERWTNDLLIAVTVGWCGFLVLVCLGSGGCASNNQVRLLADLEARLGTIESKVGDVNARAGTVEAAVGELNNRMGTVETSVGEMVGVKGNVTGVDYKSGLSVGALGLTGLVVFLSHRREMIRMRTQARKE